MMTAMKKKHDEKIDSAATVLRPIVNYLVHDIEVERINAENIPFRAAPELGCLKGRNLRVKWRIGSGRLYEINRKLVVKIVDLDADERYNDGGASFENEIKMSRLAAKIGAGPVVVDAFVCTSKRDTHYGLIILTNVRGKPLTEWLRTADAKKKEKMRNDLDRLVTMMHAHGLYHNDLWSDHVMVKAGDRPIIVDWKMASTSPSTGKRWHPDFDILQKEECSRDDLLRNVVTRAIESGIVCVDDR